MIRRRGERRHARRAWWPFAEEFGVAQSKGGRGAVDGYGLVDALVALALCSMIVTMVSGTYPLAARAVGRAGTMTQALEDHRAILFVNDVLRRARPDVRRRPDGSGELQFNGSEHRLALIADFASRGALGGSHAIELVVQDEPSSGTMRLLLVGQFHGQYTDASAQADQRILLQGLRVARFSYWGASDGTAFRWNSTWKNNNQLPALIAFEYEHPRMDRSLQRLVVRPELRK